MEKVDSRTSLKANRKTAGLSQMSENTVFVANLPWSTTTEDLRAFCEAAGPITEAHVIEYRPGRSAGVGTVTFASAEACDVAIKTLHDKELGGRPILVRADRPEADRPRTRVRPAGGEGQAGSARRRRRPRRRPAAATAAEAAQ